MTFSFTSVMSVFSALLSVTVAYMTLLRRGNLYMTRPVQIILRWPGGRHPEIILKTLLYATGKRGHVIESLFLEVKQSGQENHVFGRWSRRQGSEWVSAGLKVGEDGITSENQFLENSKLGHYGFEQGIYEIKVYAKVVNEKSPKLLHTFRLTLPTGYPEYMYIHNREVRFTLDPHSNDYSAFLSEQPVTA